MEKPLPLANFTVQDFPPVGLYCFSTSPNLNPLQDPRRLTGCYGICPNPAVSGLGLRISIYAQTILILLLATIAPKHGDIRAAMISASVTTLTVVAASIAEYRNNALSFHHTTIVINLANLPTMAFLASIIRLRSLRVVPFGPRLFSSLIIFVQFAGAITLMALAGGVSSTVRNMNWRVAQPSCNSKTVVSILKWHISLWPSALSEMETPYSTAIPILMLCLLLLFLPLAICIFMLWKSQGSRLSQLFTMHAREAHLFKRGLPIWKRLVIVFGTSVMLAWVAAIIISIEYQIKQNHVLPGENHLTYGQILSLMMIGIPLGNCTSIAIQALMETTRGRKILVACRIHQVFGLQVPPPRRLALPARQNSGSSHEIESGEYEAVELHSPDDQRGSQYSSGSSTETRLEVRPLLGPANRVLLE
ncbi:hypothetical protein FRC02_009728 [Tulasnella sp. 418]|nr:hypothetical protein FRC02_009728 [Tulasnella sp. 418]